MAAADSFAEGGCSEGTFLGVSATRPCLCRWPGLESHSHTQRRVGLGKLGLGSVTNQASVNKDKEKSGCV